MALCLSFDVHSQKSDCIDCDPKCLCLKNFAGNYTPSQKKVLTRNWSDFSGNDLENELPLLAPDQSRVNNTFSIKLDALGCIYPDFFIDADLEYDFLNDKQPITRLAKYCFYMLVYRNKDTLIRRYPENKALFTELYNITTRRISKQDNYVKLFEFKEKWNNYFLPKMMTKLKGVIIQRNIKKMVYFVQGFNVPYALAQVQGNAVFSDVIKNFDSLKQPYQDILFVRLFWPSHTSKHSDFDSSICNLDNIKNLPTGKLYSYVTNRVYMGALTLRDILFGIDNKISHHFISHSFGAALTTSIVLHPAAKISDTTSYFNSLLLKQFNSKSTPSDKHISFYLNAPAIPGQTTFAKLNSDANSRHHFYVSYNDSDEMLRKDAFRLLGITAARLNATTLGCNWDNEIERVRRLADEKKLGSNISFMRTSARVNHDYFCYREQDDFKIFFSRYIVNNIITERTP